MTSTIAAILAGLGWFLLPAFSRGEDLPREFGNSLGMRFVLVPAGEFILGSPPGEPGRDADEGPPRRVTITEPFYLGACEVTQEEYLRVMETNPSCFQGPRLPVENVPWTDAVAFCGKLSKREGKNYALPTEAQWEYACRAGSTARYGFGDDPEGLSEHAWQGVGSQGTTHPVGMKKPNPWGLYDMHGNVWEWCRDGYSPAAYRVLPRESPEYSPAEDDRAADEIGWGILSGGLRHVVRGGSWGSPPEIVRSANRYYDTPMLSFTGFRVVLGIPRP